MANRRRLSLRQRARQARRRRSAPVQPTPAIRKPSPGVQPEDVLPGDIDANLGAPWIPETDMRDFAAQLFGVSAVLRTDQPPEERRGVERQTADLRRSASVAATTDYGTARAGGVWLLELALNIKSPTIYDVIRHPDGGEERRINQDDTLAAREKQKLIKERFKRVDLRRSRAHGAAGARLQRHLQQPAPAGL